MSVIVSGIMINPVGEPVVNAQITLTAVANSLTVLKTFSATVRTDNVGAYRIQLEEGSYSITVAANGRSFVYGAVTLDDTTGPSTLNQLLKQQIMESELTPDVILYFRQIQQQVANDLATIITLESRATDATEIASNSRDEAKQYATDLETALAVAKGYRDESGVSAANAAESAKHAFESESMVVANASAAALSETNALRHRNYARRVAGAAADKASILAAEQTAEKIKRHVKTNSDRSETARVSCEQIKTLVFEAAKRIDLYETNALQHRNDARRAAGAAADKASILAAEQTIEKITQTTLNTPWINATLRNGWLLFYEDHRFVYRKVLGMVFINVKVLNAASQSHICTLPEGYRPRFIVTVPMAGWFGRRIGTGTGKINSSAILKIQTNGVIKILGEKLGGYSVAATMNYLLE